MKLIECPRDAMQGLHDYIPVDLKVRYIDLLLRVGFDTIDFGSFVSPKAVPQMRDTAAVMDRLDLSGPRSQLLAIVANRRGIDEAAAYKAINCLGFPFSISETFQRRNTNAGIEDSIGTVDYLINTCLREGKTPVVYLSMGFGNPYGDPWSPEIAAEWTGKLVNLGAPVISVADTVGIAKPQEISGVFNLLTGEFPATEFGVHLHSTPFSWHEKVDAAYRAGCRRFDGALKGYGGCPMAGDTLTGNIATENLLEYLSTVGEPVAIDVEKWQAALALSSRVFGV